MNYEVKILELKANIKIIMRGKRKATDSRYKIELGQKKWA